MKNWMKIGIFAALSLCFATVVLAGEQATKDECVAKVKAAAAQIKEQGADAVIARIMDKNPEFVWKDSYVFVLDAKSVTILAHPMLPKLIGKDQSNIKDTNGKLFFYEFINVAKEKGEGWVDYVWPKPGQTDPSPKTTFVYLVPGTDLVVCAGVYL